MTRKLEGTFNSIPVYSDPNMPKDMLLFETDKSKVIVKGVIGKHNWLGRLRYWYYRKRGHITPNGMWYR